LLVEIGYGGSIEEAGKAIGRQGDEGIDGVIKEDVLDLDVLEELISYSLSNSSLSSTTSNSVMITSFLSLSLFSTE
jgi:hypothetical protein